MLEGSLRGRTYRRPATGLTYHERGENQNNHDPVDLLRSTGLLRLLPTNQDLPECKRIT